LTAARGGSADALGRALEACRAYLLLVAERELDPTLRAKGGASDLVQQTFLEAHQDFGRFTGGSADELRAWLRQMLLHNLANFARRYRRAGKRRLDREAAVGSRGWADLPADTSSPSRRAAAQERDEALEQALARLPDDYREILVLRYWEGCRFEEVARRMGRTANAVRKLWGRAIERLQAELEIPP
ncbi:MAG: sigma-70 family RNA polymerase sigma factor, partial [Actinomycetota bacterium]